MTLAAALQLQTTSDVKTNLAKAEGLIRKAAAAGAKLIGTPEATTYLGPHEDKVRLAERIDGPTHQRFATLARELGITLLLGSVAEQLDDARTYNTSIVFGPDGEAKATYRKIHMFDVEVAGGVSFRESDKTAPGHMPVVVPTDAGVLGLSICFDLRFPELYRTLVRQGAEILTVPSAFTLMTGKDHWHVLLRARAIENQCYVFAPAQWGEHDDKGLRRSYGHALIVDPWGVVVAECSDGEGFCLADIDLERVRAARRQIPMEVGPRRLV